MPDGNARFKDGLSRIEKNVQRLTTFFSRCGAHFFLAVAEPLMQLLSQLVFEIE